MSENLVCQSCGMIMKEGFYGSNEDGSDNCEYCKYCYQNGSFTKEETLEEMVESCIPFVIKEYQDTSAARKGLREELSKLTRWR